MPAVSRFVRIFDVFCVVCIFVALEFQPFLAIAAQPLVKSNENNGSNIMESSVSGGDGASDGGSTSSSSSISSSSTTTSTPSNEGNNNSNTRGGSQLLKRASTQIEATNNKTIMAILGGVIGIILLFFGTYWQWRKRRDRQLNSTKKQGKEKLLQYNRTGAAAATAALPLIEDNSNSLDKLSSASSFEAQKPQQKRSLADLVTATNTSTTAVTGGSTNGLTGPTGSSGTAPTSGTYHFTYYKNGKPFQSKIHLRFKASDSDGDSWTITGHGKDADGKFSISEGSVSASTGHAHWVEKSEGRLVLNTGTFNFVNNKFFGGWKISEEVCGAVGTEQLFQDFRLLSREDSSVNVATYHDGRRGC